MSLEIIQIFHSIIVSIGAVINACIFDLEINEFSLHIGIESTSGHTSVDKLILLSEVVVPEYLNFIQSVLLVDEACNTIIQVIDTILIVITRSCVGVAYICKSCSHTEGCENCNCKKHSQDRLR